MIREAIENHAMSSKVAVRMARVISQFPKDDAVQFLNRMLADDYSPAVQHAALNALAHQSIGDLDQVHKLLSESTDAGVKRAAAQYIGGHGNEASIDVLMNAMTQEVFEDRTLKHSMLYALIELKRPLIVEPFLTSSENLPQQRAAVFVLNQIAPERWTPEKVFDLLDSRDPLIRNVATEVLHRQTGWANELAEPLLARIMNSDLGTAKWNEARDIIEQWMTESAVKQIWERQLTSPKIDGKWLQLVSAIPISDLPGNWDQAMSDLLDSRDDTEQLAIADWLADSGLRSDAHPKTLQALIQRAGNLAMPANNRLRYASALPKGVPPKVHGISDLLAKLLIESTDGEVRNRVAATVRKISISEERGLELLSSLGDADTLTFPTMVTAIAGSGKSNAEQLLKRLPSVPGARTLAPDFLSKVYAPYADLESQARETAERLSQPPPEMQKKLKQLLAELPKGEMVRGTRVFHGTKAACAACHKMGGVGGDIGPELTKIGQSRSRLALLEAIVYPSSHIAQGYRGVRIQTVDGQLFSGLVLRETSEELELSTGIGQTTTIKTDDIEQRAESDVSIMPNGLDGSMSKQELADVLELLTTYTSW